MGIEQLKQAIYTHLFVNGNSFKTALSGGLFYVENDSDSISYPYCVYQIIANSKDRDSFTKYYEVTIQFTIYDNQSSSHTVSSTMKSLIERLDDCESSFPSMTNYILNGVEMTRAPREVKEEGEWNSNADFTFKFQTK